MGSLCQIVVHNLNGLRPASWKVSVYFGRNADCSLAIVGSRRAALPPSCTRHLTRPVSMCFWTRTECCVPESLSKTFFAIASLILTCRSCSTLHAFWPPVVLWESWRGRRHQTFAFCSFWGPG